MTLETKTITELRGIATAIGLKVDFGWDKNKLLGKIQATVDKVIAKPTARIEPKHPKSSFIVTTLPKAEVCKELDKYKERGLSYSFSGDAVNLTVTKLKHDSCNMRVPLHDLIEAARRLCND